MGKETEAKMIRESNRKRVENSKIKKVKKSTVGKHSLSRIEERYAVKLNRVDEENIVKKIIKDDCIFVRTGDKGCNFYYVKHNNIPIKVLFHEETRGIVTTYYFDVDEYNKLVELNKSKEVKMDTDKINKTPLTSTEKCSWSAEKSKKKVINLDTGKVFDSMTDAAKHYNTSVHNISASCSKNKSTLSGRWSYYKDNVKYTIPRIKLTPASIESENKMDSSDSILGAFKSQLDVTNQVIKALEENAQLKRDIEQLEGKVKELGTDNRSISEENTKLKKTQKYLKMENDILKNKNADLETSGAIWEDKFYSMEERFNSINELNKSLVEEKNKLQGDRDILKVSLSELRESSCAEINELLLTNEELKAQLSNPNSLLERMRSFFNK